VRGVGGGRGAAGGMRGATRFVVALAEFHDAHRPRCRCIAGEGEVVPVDRPPERALGRSRARQRQRLVGPLAATGSAIGVPTNGPESRRRSMKTGAATPLVSVVVPSPMRTTATTAVQSPLPSHAAPVFSVHAGPRGVALTAHTPPEHVRVAHVVSTPGQSVPVWHYGVVVVVVELVGWVAVEVSGVCVVAVMLEFVVDVDVLVVVVLPCAAARLSACSISALHCSSSLSASAERPLPKAALSRSALIADASVSRCAPSAARLATKLVYCESSLRLPDAS